MNNLVELKKEEMLDTQGGSILMGGIEFTTGMLSIAGDVWNGFWDGVHDAWNN